MTDFQRYPAWYVVEAFEGKTETAYLRLAIAGVGLEFEPWAPVDRVRTADRRSRQPAKPRERIARMRSFRFGRFLFLRCNMSDAIWHAVSNQSGVRRVLSRIPVPDELIDFHRDNLPMQKSEISKEFSKGAIVRCINGPFEGQQGVIEDVDKKGVLIVAFELFGRSTPVCLEVEHVELVELARSPTRKAFMKPADKVRAGAAALG